MMLALKLMSSSLPLLVLHHLFFLTSLLSTLPPIFFVLFKLPSHFPSTILLSSYLLFILLPFPYHLHTSPTIFIPPLPSSYLPFLLPPLHFILLLTSFLPYRSPALLFPYILPPLYLNFTLSPFTYLPSPSHFTSSLTCMCLLSFSPLSLSLTLYILSNLHVPSIFLSSLSLPHTQWPICECDGKGVAPGALHLQHLPQATEQHYLCV